MTNGPRCQETLVEIGERLESLWPTMADAGVEDVLYIGYTMSDLTDGIHPTWAANDRLAEAIYTPMEERGMRR